MNKLYLTPSETRRYAVELPVGDAWSGPAFGKKEMPVVAVALAATSFASGVAAFTAATTLGGMIAAGATIVGSALTIIGTVTENPKLAKIGGVLALGGALAGGAANPFGGGDAAAEGAATNAAKDVVVSEGGAINEASHFSDAAFDAGMPSAASGPAMSTPSVQSGGGLINMQPDNLVRPMTDVQSQAVLDTVGTGQGQIALGADATNTMQAVAPNTLDVGGTQVAQTLKGDAFNAGDIIQNTNNEPGGLIGMNNGTSTAGGYFDKFGRWVKDNPQLAKMGSEFAAGLFQSERDKAITNAYRNRAEADRIRALWASGRTA